MNDVHIPQKDCINLRRALSMEWLETNGLGGYASSTIINCHTRKYHGLLVPRLESPNGTFVLLSNLEESLIHEGKEFHLSTFKYPNLVHPLGHQLCTGFTQSTHPSTSYRIGDTEVTRSILMPEGKNTVLIKYQALKNRVNAVLRIRPLLVFRGYHNLSRENIHLRSRTFPAKQGFLISPYDGMPSMYMQVQGSFEFLPSPDWYRNIELIKEQARGFDFREDLFSPGLLEIPFPEGSQVIVSASTVQEGALQTLWENEIERRDNLLKSLPGKGWQKRLAYAGRQFITRDSAGRKSITAGFPWFLEWGRDAMIALPGLSILPGFKQEALNILETYASEQKRGLIPNFLAKGSQGNAYNSVDAALWFGFAAQYYNSINKSPQDLKPRVWPALKETYTWYKKGTDYNIHMMDNGLLWAGGGEHQITWMDATVNGQPVTPRSGCQVENNALWYNLIRFMEDLAILFDDPLKPELTAKADQIQDSFNKCFWLKGYQYLADVWRGPEDADASLRPNQIIVLSLPYSLLVKDRAAKVLNRVRNELLTTHGLRTLSPNHSLYKGRYEGGPETRDSAYHNGTVWPWLLGHYGEALLKYGVDKQKAIQDIQSILFKFKDHFKEAGIGSISEIFDGDPPHEARGCISQAWSVAEFIRLYHLISSTSKTNIP